VTWWGHATVEVRLDGVRLVTDPLLRARVGPLHSRGHRPRRTAAEPALAGVDAVLLSHLHRDHTDLPSLRRFPRRTRVLAPAGAGRVVRRSVRGTVEELPSGSTTGVGPVRVTATAAVHDGRRDRHGPWAEAVGYLVQGSNTVYFAGDTGYYPGLAEIGRRLGPFDLALIPIGGYMDLPRHHPNHVNPEEAVQLFEDVRGRLLVPMHWGTFVLNREPAEEPPARLMAEALRRGLEERMAVLSPGQTIHW